MIAAVYARKSTDQTGVADEERSVTRQVEHAKAYAATKGWAVDDAHVYVDDGISGAEFAARPGYIRLMTALAPKPPFQVLIMSEESRLGREQIETGYSLKQIITAGVQVWYYLEDRERRLDSPLDSLLMAVSGFSDSMEREKARQRVTDKFQQKARAGHVCGGRVFGYDNVPVDGHVERRINEAEAAVVRDIFAWSAQGWGFTRIAKALNEQRARCPRPQGVRPAGWSPSTVRDVLLRDLYRGVVVWNKSRKRDRWGRVAPSGRPESEWLRREAPELRVVDEDVWAAAHARLAGLRTRLAGRAVIRRDVESRWLLSGFARCATCGGSLSVVSWASGSGRAFRYGCLANWKRGRAVCPNALTLPVAVVDDAVLTSLAGETLRDEVVLGIIEEVFRQLETPVVESNRAALQAELVTLDRRIARIVAAVEGGGAVEALVAQLRLRQAERESLLLAIGAAEAVRLLPAKREVERTVLEKVARWRALLTEEVADGRQALREVLTSPIRFTPEGQAYRFEAEVATGRLIAGCVGAPPCVASPRGGGPGWTEGSAGVPPWVASPTGNVDFRLLSFLATRAA